MPDTGSLARPRSRAGAVANRGCCETADSAHRLHCAIASPGGDGCPASPGISCISVTGWL